MARLSERLYRQIRIKRITARLSAMFVDLMNTSRERRPAADVLRDMGCDPSVFAAVEWHGDDIVCTSRSVAREIKFTVGHGLLDNENSNVGDAK